MYHSFIKSGGVDFNPRSLAGATTFFVSVYDRQKISIHAPSRERQQWQLCIHICYRFQSTLPRGSDGEGGGIIIIGSAFQSTLPRGSDGVGRCSGLYPEQFQSTLPRGSDIKHHLNYNTKGNFNPRSLAGATCSSRVRSSSTLNFNPRSLAGATRGCARLD